MDRTGRWTCCLAALILWTCMQVEGQDAVENLLDPQDQFIYAQGLQKRGLFDRAEEQYRDFLKKHGDHQLAANAHVNLIACLKSQGNKTREMLECIDAFRKKYPQDKNMETMIGEEAALAYAAKDYARAAECFKLLKGSADVGMKESASYYLALCLRSQSGQDTDEVVALLRELAGSELSSEYPFRVYALKYLSDKSLRDGNIEAAQAGFIRICKDKGVPDEIRENSMYLLGEAFNARGKTSEALKVYEACLGNYPDGPSSREVRKRRAMLLFDMKKYDEALEKLTDWRHRYGNVVDFDMDYVHGVCLYNLQRCSEARPFFVRIVENPDVPVEIKRSSHAILIQCLYVENDWEQAGQRIDDFLVKYPNYSEKAQMVKILATVRQKQGQFDAAEKSYRQAFELYTGNVESQEQCLELLAAMFMANKQHDKAAAEFLRASEIKGSARSASFLWQAAECEYQAGRLDLAKRDFQRVVKEYPKALQEVRISRYQLLEMAITDNDFAVAEGHARELLKTETGVSAETLTLRLVSILYNNKKRDEAIKVLEGILGKPLAGGDKIDKPLKSMACQIYLSEANGKTGQRIAGQSHEMLKGLEILNGYLDKYHGEELSGHFLYQAGTACMELRTSKIDLKEMDIAACEMKVWRMLWNRKDEADWACRGGLELARRLGEGGEKDRQEAAKLLKVLHEWIPEAEAVLKPDERMPFRCEILSMLSNSLFVQKQYTQALDCAEKVLVLSSGGMKNESVSLAWLVKAKILFEVDGNPTDALRFATMCYIVGNHDRFNPEAILLAVRIHLAQGNVQAAREAWDELQHRYPLQAEEKRGLPELKKLFE